MKEIMRFYRNLLTFLCILIANILLRSDELRASLIYIPNTYGLSARGLSLVNALAADAEDSSACYYNPAGLASTDQTQMELTYLYSWPLMKGGLDNGRKVEERFNNKILSFSIKTSVSKLFQEKFNVPPIGFGINVAVDDNAGTMMAFDDERSSFGRFTRFGMANFVLQGAFGIEITPWMSFGIGIHGGFKGYGSVKTHADVNGDTYNEGMKMRGGFRPQPLTSLNFYRESWNIGIVYRAQTNGSFEPINVEAEPSLQGFDIETMNLNLNFLDTFAPHQVMLGATWQVIPQVKLFGQFDWRKWGEYDKIAKESQYVGAVADFDTVDLYTPRAALEYEAIENLDLRFGYRYEQTPFRKIGTRFPRTGEKVKGTVILDSDAHVMGFGMGYVFDKRTIIKADLNIDFAYQFHYFQPRKANTSDGYTFTSQGTLHLISFGTGLRF